MKKFKASLKQYFWPVSALVFCPCHLPLTMAAGASLTAGTALGAYINSNYSSIETVLAVSFSFYFVLAFMIWVVRGPQQADGAACAVDENGQVCLNGLSTQQIVVWGLIGMFTMPALIAISIFAKENFVDQTITPMLAASPIINSGFIWLVSLATVVMIPVMIIWLVWMWLAWTKTDPSKVNTETWTYEYD
jgi:hypothetical protein